MSGFSRFWTSGSAQYAFSSSDGHDETIQPLPSTTCSGVKIIRSPRKTSEPSLPRMANPLSPAEALLKVPLSETLKFSLP